MSNAIIYVLSTLLTYIMGVVNKKYSWQLPIPIQNIVIGIGIFVGAIIAYHVLGIQYNYEILVEHVVSALGGAGTATLGYDTSKINKE